MKCPNCRAEATVDHIKAQPECAEAIASLCARYRMSKKVNFTPGPGRPKGAGSSASQGKAEAKKNAPDDRN